MTLHKKTKFKNASGLQTFRDSLALMLEEYPNSLKMVQNMVNIFYNTHFDKKKLLEEIQSTIYQFDRITLMKIMTDVKNYWSDADSQLAQKNKVVSRIRKIAKEFVKFGEPKLDEDEIPPNILTSCDTNITSSYCSGKKLLVPEKQFDNYLQLFADDMFNPLKNPYILALIFTDNVIDCFIFQRVPGEEIFIKFY